MREDPLFQIIPGYREAVEHETTVREAAFLSVTETVCGFECLPFSPLHYSMLDCSGSPFVRGGVPMAEDVAVFLWCVSPDYAPDAGIRRWRHVRRTRGLDYEAAVVSIRAFIDDAFADAPGTKGGHTASYYSGTAAMVDLLASQYGWAESAIIRLPFKRIFQYARCIRQRHEDRPIFFNRSDRVIADWQERDEAARRERETATRN